MKKVFLTSLVVLFFGVIQVNSAVACSGPGICFPTDPTPWQP